MHHKRNVISRREIGGNFTEPKEGESYFDIERENQVVRIFYHRNKYPNMTIELAKLAYFYEYHKFTKTPANIIREMMPDKKTPLELEGVILPKKCFYCSSMEFDIESSVNKNVLRCLDCGTQITVEVKSREDNNEMDLIKLNELRRKHKLNKILFFKKRTIDIKPIDNT